MTQPTLLLISEDQQLCYLLTRYGEQSGCRVLTVATIEDVLLSQPRPDVVLLHLLSPEQDWEQMRRLKTHPAVGGLPITIISSVIDEERSRAEGVAHSLWQPVMYADFLASLARILGWSQPPGLDDS